MKKYTIYIQGVDTPVIVEGTFYKVDKNGYFMIIKEVETMVSIRNETMFMTNDKHSVKIENL